MPDSGSETGEVLGEIVLELDSVSKAYLGTQAVSDASLICRAGEIHALVGENGAGKSTLIKIASGAVVPDSGTVRIGGKPLGRANPQRARQLGLLTAYQDTALVPELTVAENVLISFHGLRRLGWRLRLDSTAELLEPYGLALDPSAVVSTLSPASRQLLEVVRALIHHPRVLILDEPTAALDVVATDKLEILLEAARAEGASILYISHRLDEVQRIATRLTVLRDGRIEGSYAGSGWPVDEIVTKMAGTAVDLEFPKRAGDLSEAGTILAARDLVGNRFGPVSITVREGEIVGIAGAEGNGQRELVRGLAGVISVDGEFTVDGAAMPRVSVKRALTHRVRLLSGDRAAESIFGPTSVMENATLGLGRQLGRFGLVSRRREKALFRTVSDDIGIVHASNDQPIKELSGGNQQKVVVARGLLEETRMLIVDEPTQGVDARARLQIYRVLRDQANGGVGVLVNSSDADELAGICDRVYVLSRGVVVKELEGEALTRERIVRSFVDVGETPAVPLVDPERVAPIAAPTPGRNRRRLRSAIPLIVLGVLIVGTAIFAGTQSPIFFTPGNLNGMLLASLPLAVAALGQLFALMSAEFDISIGSTISLTVVVASFVATSDTVLGTVPGILLILAIGVVIGLFNSFVVRILRVNAIIATIATLGILQGIAILLRPTPGGFISFALGSLVSTSWGFLPVLFIVVVLVAVGADFWRTKTPGGLRNRAAGFSEEPARRTGLPVGWIKIRAYCLCALFAVIAGIILGAQVGVGSNSVGVGYPLLVFTACFLGGAALTGGRGSFIGVLLGVIFLSMLNNVVALLNLPISLAAIAAGVLTILAVLSYSSGFRRSGAGRSRRPGLGATAGKGE